MNKSQLKEEKKTVEIMSKRYKSLNAEERKELLRLKCRTDFITYARFITENEFKPFRVHKLLCEFIQNIADGNPDFTRTVVSLPPRTGKSLLVSRILPSWQLGRNPKAQFIMSSYALNLSTENSRAVLDYITSEKFLWVFPECIVERKNCNLTAIRTSKGGLIKTASAGGNVTGFGFGTIEEDDLPGIGLLDDLLPDGNSMTVMDSTFNWVQTQFLTRALPNNAIISMGTRFHHDDVTGRLIAAAPDIWKVLNVKAICDDEEEDPLGRKLGESHWPEFFSEMALNLIRRNIGERDFTALYQGSPTVESGSIFKDYWLGHFSDLRDRYSYKFATIDTAYQEKDSNNDYSCICIWGFERAEQRLYLLDVVLERLDFPDLQRVVTKVVEKWKLRAIYIEGRSSGQPLIQTLRRFMRISIKELTPHKDKVLRANSVAPLVAAGVVYLNEKIADLDERIKELMSFPYIKNDDFVDAFVYGIVVARDELGVKIIDPDGTPTLAQIQEDYGASKARGMQTITHVDDYNKVIGHKIKEIPVKTRPKIKLSGTDKHATRLKFR